MVMFLEPLRQDLLASGSEDDYTIAITNAVAVERRLSGHTGGVVALMTHDNLLYSSSKDNTLRIWDPIKGTCLKELHGHSDFAICMVMLPNLRLASGGFDETVRIWDLRSNQCQCHHLTSNVYALSFGQGQLLAGSDDNVVRWVSPMESPTQFFAEGAISILQLSNGNIAITNHEGVYILDHSGLRTYGLRLDTCVPASLAELPDVGWS